MILQALKYGGVPIQTAPMVRNLAEDAYKAGAKLVDVLWRDDDLNLIRFEHLYSGNSILFRISNLELRILTEKPEFTALCGAVVLIMFT